MPVTVAQSLAHDNLAAAIVVIPRIVQKVKAAVKRGSDNANAFILSGHANVIAAQANGGNAFFGGTKVAIDHPIARLTL